MQIIISSQGFLFMVIILFVIPLLNPPTTSFFSLVHVFSEGPNFEKAECHTQFLQTQQKRHFSDVSLYLYISRQDSLKKIFRGVPSNQSPSAKGTCWWQICISLWFMVIKI